MPFVRSGDADINYTIQGEGIPVLLIMGLAADQSMWLMQVPALLGAGYQVITLDNRGVGGSSSPPGPYTMEQMAGDALAVLDAAAADRAHVIGVSMGGAIAQHLTLKAPERVRSLMLVSTWATMNAWTRRVEELGRMILDKLGREALIKSSMLYLFTPKTVISNDALVQQVEQMAIAMQGSADAFVNQTAGVVVHDTLERCNEIAAPTFVLVGRRDILVPPELSQQIADAIPGSTFKMIDGGHAFTFENASEFNAEMLAWLQKN